MQNLDTEQSKDGIRQMIKDLERLAKDDGNIAAAWALEVLVHRYAPGVARTNWLFQLKKGDIVHSRSQPYEFLELYTGSLVESGVGAYLLINGEPKLLDSFWLERPLESFN